MKFNLTEDLCYFVEKGIYEQKMAIDNMVFILSKNSENNTFLSSQLFEKLHNKLIEKTALRWYREQEVVTNFVNKPFNTYFLDLTHRTLFVETK